MNKLLLAIALLSYAGFSIGADLVIYPAEGQSTEQQQKDEGECFVWAKGNSGFDPLATPTAPAAAANEGRRGGAVRGAAGGAAVGAIVGNSDDAAKGAAAGAVLGKMRQNRRNRAATESNQSNTNAAQASTAVGRDKYDRAYSACLKGRGYSVN